MRLLRHLFARSARHLFPEDRLHRIADAIAAGELRHRGEILFAVESELPAVMVLRGVQARARAEAAFARLRAWDTEANNGVLIYLLLADHRIEIVADRGLAGRVSAEQWRGVCLLIEERMRAGEPEQAVVQGIEAVSALLATHFPQGDGRPDLDELPNLPLILD
ncbi:MAG: TPM domain-containing protein [Pseudoxanthomonas sp.]